MNHRKRTRRQHRTSERRRAGRPSLPGTSLGERSYESSTTLRTFDAPYLLKS